MIAVLVLACSHVPTATLDVGGHPVKVEIVANEANRAKGLMHRASMPEDAGMLFVYREAREREFWMKNTPLPLTIAFADSSGRIVRLVDMRPFDTRRVQSLAPARYALEMNQGWFERHGVTKGALIGGIPTHLDVE